MAPVPDNLKLNSGYEIPNLGLGFTKVSAEPGTDLTNHIRTAVKVGFRHFDTSQMLRNETKLGEALSEVFKTGECKREDVFLTTKIWCTNHNPQDAKESVQKNLEELQTDYLDLLLIHWPMAYKHGDELYPKDAEGKVIMTSDDYLDTWKIMEEFVEAGQVRSIGLANFNSQQIQRVWDNSNVKPSNLQVELNAYLPNQELADFCKEKEIAVSCSAPCSNHNRDNSADPILQEEPVVKAIAERLGKKPPQILMRFLMQKGYAVLPKTVNVARLAPHLVTRTFELDDGDMARIAQLGSRNLRHHKEEMAKHSKFYPF